MLTGSEDYATTQLHFASDATQAATAWKRRAWGLAIALADEGHFVWEDLRQALLKEWGSVDAVQDWAQCQRWLSALAGVARNAGLVDSGLIAELSQWADRAAAREQA
ncbi:MAG TPA: hypothetical protein VFX59_31640 [Polyangiales bacterium]|nr:hypothetical protein [Polyangiales bacterium]